MEVPHVVPVQVVEDALLAAMQQPSNKIAVAVAPLLRNHRARSAQVQIIVVEQALERRGEIVNDAQIGIELHITGVEVLSGVRFLTSAVPRDHIHELIAFVDCRPATAVPDSAALVTLAQHRIKASYLKLCVLDESPCGVHCAIAHDEPIIRRDVTKTRPGNEDSITHQRECGPLILSTGIEGSSPFNTSGDPD